MAGPKLNKNELIVGRVTEKWAPEKMRLKDLFRQYMETYPFAEAPWRRYKASEAIKRYSHLRNSLVNEITESDAYLKDANESQNQKIKMTLQGMFRFICDGKKILFDMKGEKNGNETPGHIQPIEMTIEQAMRMLRTAKRNHGEVIENILADLEKTPKGTPYAFTPAGVKMTPMEFKRLTAAIANAIRDEKLAFLVRIVKNKNVAIIFHESDLKDKYTKRNGGKK